MPGRHRMRKRFRGAGVVAAAVTLAAVVGGARLAYQEFAGGRCGGQVTLSVAVAPELAAAVERTAQAWAQQRAASPSTCVTVQVAAADPVDVAAALADRYGAALAGVGGARGTMVVPDVWVPDSSTWLLRLRAATSRFTAVEIGSIALSPVVLAAPEPVAANLGWPDKKLSWADLRQEIITNIALRTGIVDPTRDAAGLSGLLALGGTEAADVDAGQAQAAVLRTLATGRSALRDDILARFPRSSDPATVNASLCLAPLGERDVVTFNAARPPVRLAALYLEPAPPPLDYPFSVLTTDPIAAAAADELSQALTTPAFHDELATVGLRVPDGNWGSGFTPPQGAPSPTGGLPLPRSTTAGADSAAALDRALAVWSAVTAPGRILAAIDVSSSMLGRVPTAGNATRMQVTLEAAQRGLSLFDDGWQVGLWIFAGRLAGVEEHRQLVPIGPLGSRRDDVRAALSRTTAGYDDSGLHSTVLAAYREVRDGWQAGRVNSVVILTDGVGDASDEALPLPELVAELQQLKDPTRPVQVIFVGLGDAVQRQRLEQITAATGGGVLIARDPAKIGDVFLKAISLRTGTPR